MRGSHRSWFVLTFMQLLGIASACGGTRPTPEVTVRGPALLGGYCTGVVPVVRVVPLPWQTA
jgi:hypothetical protein